MRYKKQLFGFQKVPLSAGETKIVTFTVNTQSLAFYNAQMKLVVEPGQFNVSVYIRNS